MFLPPNGENADFFESVAAGRNGKLAANWIINELFGRLNKCDLTVQESPVVPEQLGAILDLIDGNAISGKIAKDLFEIVWNEGGDPVEIVELRGMRQVTDTSAIREAVEKAISDFPRPI